MHSARPLGSFVTSLTRQALYLPACLLFLGILQALMRSDPEAGVAVLVHELTHALGFTDDMFDKFIDDSGQPIPKSQVGSTGAPTLQPRSRAQPPGSHWRQAFDQTRAVCLARVSVVGWGRRRQQQQPCLWFVVLAGSSPVWPPLCPVYMHMNMNMVAGGAALRGPL